jgi:Arc/MetJ-type ribon-helix-helix transcriptional regulator
MRRRRRPTNPIREIVCLGEDEEQILAEMAARSRRFPSKSAIVRFALRRLADASQRSGGDVDALVDRWVPPPRPRREQPRRDEHHRRPPRVFTYQRRRTDPAKEGA